MKTIKQQKELVVDLQVFNQDQEVVQLKKTSFFWRVSKSLATSPNPHSFLLLEPAFDAMLLEEEMFEEKRFQFQLSEECGVATLASQQVEVLVRLTTFKQLHKKMLKLLEEHLQTQEHTLKLLVDNQKLKTTNEEQIATFTKKVKALEEKATLEVRETTKRNKLELEERFEGEKAELKLYGAQKFFSDFLGHFITFEQVVQSGLGSDNSLLQNYVKGFEMIITNMLLSLTESGIKRIEPKVGEVFDAAVHSAESVVADQTKQPGEIVAVKSHGYALHSRLLIPAVVVINRL